MIAQDFARVGVLASGSIATPYGGASTCAYAGKRPARARPAQSVQDTTFEKGKYLIESK